MWRFYTLKVDVKYLHHRNPNTDNRNGLIAFADFLLSFFIVTQDKSAVGMDCRAPPFNPDFSNIRIGGKQKMAYNHGKEERKWRLWKEAEEKILREHGVDERTIEEIRTYDRVDFNSNRRFYRWTNNVAEYLEEMSDTPPQKEVFTVTDLLNAIENKNLYQMLLR